MGKSKRTPVEAAGGIVIRPGGKPQVAIVQRRKDGAWVLPKGKLKPNEKPIAAARREAREETGHDVRVHEFLGVISYEGGSGPKIAHFWRMQAVGDAPAEPMDDIKAVEWLPLTAAIDRLSLPHEQIFLRNVGHRAMKAALDRARIGPPTQEKAQEKAQQKVREQPQENALPLIVEAPPLAAGAAATVPRRPQPPGRRDIFAWLAERWKVAMRWIGRKG
jgi:8-oxo-dGTP diphosphatase